MAQETAHIIKELAVAVSIVAILLTAFSVLWDVEG